MREININGIDYVAKEDIQQEATQGDYVIVRTYSAGVFAGTLVSKEGKEVELANARRLWQWYGAASISQLAVDGTSQPTKCKFPCEVLKLVITEAIEIAYCTQKAMESIKAVPVWKA